VNTFAFKYEPVCPKHHNRAVLITLNPGLLRPTPNTAADHFAGNAHAMLLQLPGLKLSNVLLLRSLSSLSIPLIEGGVYNQGVDHARVMMVLRAF
jgi:hypothetical protein